MTITTAQIGADLHTLLLSAKTDVPLIEGETVTREGERYLVQARGHVCDYYANCEDYLKVSDEFGDWLDIPTRE